MDPSSPDRSNNLAPTRIRMLLQLQNRWRDLLLRRRLRPYGGAVDFVRAHLSESGFCWCFILGVNNSGTTLVSRILSRHPEIRSLPQEGQRLTDALPRPRRHDVSRSWSRRLDLFRFDESSPADCVEQIVFDWLHYYDLEPGVLLEKSPPNAVRSLWLQRHFVPSRFIAIVRNPFAVAEGIRRREGIDLEVGAQHWRVSNEILLNDLSRLEHKILIKYEDFCREPLGELESIRNLLDLEQPFASTMLDNPEPGNGARLIADIEDQNTKSIARLTQEEIGRIARITEPMSQQLGYETPLAGPAPARFSRM